METEDLRTSLQRRIASVLEDAPHWLREPPAEATSTLFALETFGDALRAGVQIPPSPRRWLRDLRDHDARTSLDLVLTEVPGWSTGAADEALDFALRRRDQSASALAALAWRFLSHPPGPEFAGVLDAVDRALGGFDATLTLGRNEVDALLGERVCLEDTGWRAKLRDDRTFDDVDDGHVLPSDAMVDAWLRDGRFHRSVEAAAVRDGGFAEDLAALVEDALHDARGDRTLPVSFAARKWQQRNAKRVHIDVEMGRVALAAAAYDAPSTETKIPLGLLAPLAAEAEVRVVAGRATLSVYAEPGVVASVSVGASKSESDADGTCAVSFPVTAQAVPVRVRSSDGTEVGFDLSFPDASDAR